MSDNLSTPLTLAAYAGNIAWFGMAFQVFTLGARKFVLRHTTKEHRGHEDPVVYAVKFLGGMNSALALLSLLRIVRWFQSEPQRKTSADKIPEINLSVDRDILLCSAVGHFSQFAFNIPSFLQSYTSSDTLPFRFSREMMFIFIVDAAMAAFNIFALQKL